MCAHTQHKNRKIFYYKSDHYTILKEQQYVTKHIKRLSLSGIHRAGNPLTQFIHSISI